MDEKICEQESELIGSGWIPLNQSKFGKMRLEIRNLRVQKRDISEIREVVSKTMLLQLYL